MKFEIYQQQGTILGNPPVQWRWRLRAANGRIIADSGEGYNNHGDCAAAILLVMDCNRSTPVDDHQHHNRLAQMLGINAGGMLATNTTGGMLAQGLRPPASIASLGIGQRPRDESTNALSALASLGIKHPVR
jgi:uncharacterized protein YegP (UPF0339 family)